MISNVTKALSNLEIIKKLNELIHSVNSGTGHGGKSAYDIAVDNGFIGTEEEWLASLKGDTGPQGQQGIQGVKGDTGSVGPKGDDGPIGPQGKDGPKGDAGGVGPQGKSATITIGNVVKGDVANVENVGTETDAVFQFTLPKGDKGTPGKNGTNGSNGKSAYQVAVSNGFIGSEEEWLASLKGESGDPATNIIKSVNGHTGVVNLTSADVGAIQYAERNIDDANQWLENGYVKMNAEAPNTNLPDECSTALDRWGILFNILENEEQGTGSQMFFPIDGKYKGRTFTRALTNIKTPYASYGKWLLSPIMDDIPSSASFATKSDLNSKADKSQLDNLATKAELNAKANPEDIPTDNAGLTNGAGYITSSALNGYATTGQLNNYIPTSSRNTNGGVAGINSQGHLILPNGTELW